MHTHTHTLTHMRAHTHKHTHMHTYTLKHSHTHIKTKKETIGNSVTGLGGLGEWVVERRYLHKHDNHSTVTDCTTGPLMCAWSKAEISLHAQVLCVCVCVHLLLYLCVSACMYISMHILPICLCICARICAYMGGHGYGCKRVNMYVCVCAHFPAYL